MTPKWVGYATAGVELAYATAGAKYAPPGDEGEWEIRGEHVSAQGFRVSGAPVHDDGEHEGQWLRPGKAQ